MKLMEHNERTLEQVEQFVSKHQDCCVVNPCGSGKTSVMAAFIKNHIDKTFVIITKQKNAANYYVQRDPVFSNTNIKIRTYNKLYRDYDASDLSDYASDFLIVDEAHYIGADKWNLSFTAITKKHNPIVIGFTATPQRYKDQGTETTIVNQYFGNNSAGNYSSVELQTKGVFQQPEYVLSIYDINKTIEDKLMKIEFSDLPDNAKAKWTAKLEAALDKWEKESNPEKVFAEKLPNFMYKPMGNKILIYTPSVNDLYEKKAKIDSTIRTVFPKRHIKSYVYTYKTNESELKGFNDDNGSYIKILYSIDKIMETIHIDDLNIAIMLRPSVSHRIVTQQFGRVNSIGNKNKPLIIDMVDNLSTLEETRTYFASSIYNTSTDKSKKGIDMQLPHMSYYCDLFAQIDEALSRFKLYTFRGITGCISDLCRIFRKDANEVRERMDNGVPINEAMYNARDVKPMMSQEIIDGTSKYGNSDEPLTEEEKEYMSKHMYIVDNVMKKFNVKDEDIKQDLYLEFAIELHKIYTKYGNSHATHAALIRRMRQLFVMMYRDKRTRKEYITSYEEHIKNRYIIRDDLAEDMKRAYQLIVRILARYKHGAYNTRKYDMFIYRFGLYPGYAAGEREQDIKEVARRFGITQSRTHQIMHDIRRRLRYNSYATHNGGKVMYKLKAELIYILYSKDSRIFNYL